ncbi:MAG: glutaredoxin domain-containing protein [Candidatus Omnitrophota bacterium]
MADKILVYSTRSCPYCIRLKQFLSENNIPFENYDVGQDSQKVEEMSAKSGQMGVPVLDINGEIIVGFDRDKIKQVLGI